MSVDYRFCAKKAYEVIVKNPSILLLSFLISLIQVPLLWYQENYALAPSATDYSQESLNLILKNMLVYEGLSVVVGFIGLLIGIVIIKLAYDSLMGVSSLKTAFRTAIYRIFFVLAAIVLLCLAVLVPLAVVFFIVIVGGLCLSIILLPFALILLVYIAIRLIFYIYPIVLFKKGPIGGLEESWAITEDRVMEVLPMLIILALLSGPVMVVELFFPGNFFIVVPVVLLGSVLSAWGSVFSLQVYLYITRKYPPELSRRPFFENRNIWQDYQQPPYRPYSAPPAEKEDFEDKKTESKPEEQSEKIDDTGKVRD